MTKDQAAEGTSNLRERLLKEAAVDPDDTPLNALLSEAAAALAQAEGEIAELKEQRKVTSLADWCLEERAVGNGGCGACVYCVKDMKDRAEVAEAERDRLKTALREVLTEYKPLPFAALRQEHIDACPECQAKKAKLDSWEALLDLPVSPAAREELVECLCEIDRHDFSCPVHGAPEEPSR